MKNIYYLFVAVMAVWVFSACASTHPAVYAVDDIYYTPNAERAVAVEVYDGELEALRAKTKAETASSSYTLAETGDDVVYIPADTNAITVEAEPEITYVILDDDDSYERRLRMFDDPHYTVTINLGWSDPWYYGSRFYGGGWYLPYYYRGWNYYYPYSWGYYDYWGYYDFWHYRPYYYGGYYSHYHNHHNHYYANGHYGRSSSLASTRSSGNRNTSMNRAGVAAGRSPEARQVAGASRGSTGRGAMTTGGQRTRDVVGNVREITGTAGNRGTREVVGNGAGVAGRNIAGEGRTTRVVETGAVSRPSTGVGRGTSASSRNVQNYTRPESASRSVYNAGSSSRNSSTENSTINNARGNYQSPVRTGNNRSSSGNDSYTPNTNSNRNSSSSYRNEAPSSSNNHRSSSSSNSNSNSSSYRSSGSSSSSSGSSSRSTGSSGSSSRSGGSSGSSGGSSRGGGGGSSTRR